MCQFSIIIEPLFESYNGMVSTASAADLCRSTLSWLDQHCSLPALRPSESNTLYTNTDPNIIWTFEMISFPPHFSQWFWVHSASLAPPQPSWPTPACCQSRPPLLWRRVSPLLPWTTPYSPPLRTVCPPCEGAEQNPYCETLLHCSNKTEIQDDVQHTLEEKMRNAWDNIQLQKQ